MPSFPTSEDLVPIASLIDRLFAQSLGRRPALLSRRGGHLQAFWPGRISHFFAARKRSHFYYGDRRHTLEHSLTALQQQLGGDRFVRVHRAVLVNWPRVRAIVQRGRRTFLVLDDCHQVPVSRRARPDLLQRLRWRTLRRL